MTVITVLFYCFITIIVIQSLYYLLFLNYFSLQKPETGKLKHSKSYQSVWCNISSNSLFNCSFRYFSRFSCWHTREPNNYRNRNEQCMEMWHLEAVDGIGCGIGRTWNDTPCKDKRAVMCEMEPKPWPQ